MDRVRKSASLYLRVDGTLLISSGERAIELRLLPEQLLHLGADAMKLALELDPLMGERAADALANITFLVPIDEPPTHPVSPDVH